MMHMFMLARTKAPEWSISDAEALKLGNAVSDVLAEYGLTASRKIGAWGTLAMISGEVYGGRVLHYVGRSVGNSKPKAAPSQPAHNPFAGFAVAA